MPSVELAALPANSPADVSDVRGCQYAVVERLLYHLGHMARD